MSERKDLSDKVQIGGDEGKNDDSSTFEESLKIEILRLEGSHGDLGKIIDEIERQETKTSRMLRVALRPITDPGSNGQLRSEIRRIAALSRDIVLAYLSTVRSKREDELPGYYDVALHANAVTDSIRHDLPLAKAWSALLYGNTSAYKARSEGEPSKFIVEKVTDVRGGVLEVIVFNPYGSKRAYAGMFLRYVRKEKEDYITLSCSMLETFRHDESDKPAEASVSILVDTDGRVRGQNFPIGYETHSNLIKAMPVFYTAIKNAMPLSRLRRHNSQTLENRFEEILAAGGIRVKFLTKDKYL